MINWRIFKTLSIITLLLTGIGCQKMPPPNRPPVNTQVRELFADAIVENTHIAKKIELNEDLYSELSPDTTSISPAGIKISEQKFDISAKDVPAQSFFMGLMDGSGYNALIHPKLTGNITLKLDDVTVIDTLRAVKDVYGYDFVVQKNNIQILPAELQTKSFHVNYLDITRDGRSQSSVVSGSLTSNSNNGNGNNNTFGNTNNNTNNNNNNNNNNNSSSSDDIQVVNSQITTTNETNFWHELKTAIQTLLVGKEGRKVAISPMSGLVIVQALPSELRQIEDYIKKAEKSLNRQVILEAKIIEVELESAYQAGINWAVLSNRLLASQTGGGLANSSFFGEDIINTSTRTSSPSFELNPKDMNLKENALATSTFGGIFTLAFNYKNLAGLVELLSSQGNVQVLSSPRVATTNNQKALIKIGSEEYYVTNVSSSTVTGLGGVGQAAASPNIDFEPFFSGIALDVTPQISKDDEIILHIHPTISQVIQQDKTVTLSVPGSNQAQQQVFPLAASSIRESDSIVKAKSGQVVIIGGLMQDKTQDTQTGIPGLQSLPGIGQFFRQTEQRKIKSELVILLRPIVVDHTSAVTELQSTYNRVNEIFDDIKDWEDYQAGKFYKQNSTSSCKTECEIECE